MQKVVYEIFMSKNLSVVKNYLHYEWSKLMNNHVNLGDFVMAKEVKLGKYANLLPAHALVGKKIGEQDPMKQPKYGERVKYLVIQGSEKSRVKDLVISVPEYLQQDFTLNVEYYLKR